MEHSVEEWLSVIEEWLRQNPGKDVNDIPNKERIELNGEIYNIGQKIAMQRNRIKNGEQVDQRYLAIGLKEKSNNIIEISNEEWLAAIELWLSQNPEKDVNDIPNKETIELNGKIYNIGQKIGDQRKRLKKSKRVDPRYLALRLKISNNNSKEKHTEEEWLAAIELWLSQNPGKDVNDIPNKETIELNGEIYSIGRKISAQRQKVKNIGQVGAAYHDLSIKIKSSKEQHSNEEWLVAINYWLKQNPGKDVNDIPNKEIIELNGEIYNIGAKVTNLRQLLKEGKQVDSRYLDLGLKERSNNIIEIPNEEWLAAIKLWLSQNPDKDINDIQAKETIELNGQKYNIGNKISHQNRKLKKR